MEGKWNSYTVLQSEATEKWKKNEGTLSILDNFAWLEDILRFVECFVCCLLLFEAKLGALAYFVARI